MVAKTAGKRQTAAKSPQAKKKMSKKEIVKKDETRGRKPKFSMAELVAVAKATTAKRATEEQADKAVVGTTKEQYASRVRQLEIFAKAMGSKKVTKDLFILYINSYDKLGAQASSTAEGYRDAALHWFDSGRWKGTNWAASAVVKRVCSGFRYNSGKKKTTPERGTITGAMFVALIAWLDRMFPHMTDGARLQFGAGLRISELILVQAGDYKKKNKELSIRKDKTQTAKTVAVHGHKEGYKKTIVDPDTQELLNKLQDNAEIGSLLFPASVWRVTHYRTALKEAAIALQWPKDLKYDGTHVLRHGGIGKIVSICKKKGASKKELRKATGQSPAMQKHYSRENSARRNGKE